MGVVYNGTEGLENMPDLIEEFREDKIFVFGDNMAIIPILNNLNKSEF